MSFFGIQGFPFDQLRVRSEGKYPKMYFLSSGVSEYLSAGEGQLRLINTGVRIFESHTSKDPLTCYFRVSYEGSQTLLPYLSKRVVPITEADLVVMLTEKDPFFVRLSLPAQNLLNSMEMGAIVFTVDLTNHGVNGPVVVPAWRGKVSCRLFLPTEDAASFTQLFVPQQSQTPVEVETEPIKQEDSDKTAVAEAAE